MSQSPLARFALKGLAFFSVLRGYNIALIVLAQYLCSIFILAPEKPLKVLLFDLHLALLVLATAIVIGAGYLINSFYDIEKDLINRPKKTLLDRLISQRAKITAYFVFNFSAVFIASAVSFRAVIFFSAYIFGIWLYSHKLKRIPFIGNFISACLAIMPFFTVFVYYKNGDSVIFVHASFLFFLILARDMVKDLENLAGDFLQDYKTVAVSYGISFSKTCISALLLGAAFPSLALIYYFDIGQMDIYFKGALVLIFIAFLSLWRAQNKTHYVWLHNLLKAIIVAGVFGILLIDPQLVLGRFF
ncbi:MAG: 4-hydroxybenzoate polyprenyltransferase [Flavobacteriaceae bacterium]|jgi:4-hydroxybenzoate polyprenyltransferase